ncbi:Inner membrane ABC transporter permease protein ycjP [uncultured Clostridium sp.]|nr:Inner membrane ABC transporter permease protein ycjP [uncultured Clostridium sp.]
MKKKRWAKAVIYAFLVIFAVIALFPVLFTLINSFMGAQEYAQYYGGLQNSLGQQGVLHLIPDRMTLEGYYNMLFAQPDYLMKFWLSLLMCFAIVAGQVVIAVLGGYALAKFRFPGRNIAFYGIILLMMMPYQVTLVSNYIVLDKMGLIGNYLSIILPGIFSAFGVFLMRQVIAAVPDGIMEAAKIDGAGAWRVLWRVVLPNCLPGLASLVILSFIDNWNMVEQPLVFLQDSFQYPLSTFLTQINAAQPALGFACGLLAMIPPVLLFCFFEKELIQGIGYLEEK